MRRLLAVLVLALTACAPAPSTLSSGSPTAAARAPAKLVVTYGSINGDDLPTWVALEAGIFQKNGLDVDLQLASSSSAAMAALVSGKAQVVQTGGSDAVSASVGGSAVLVVAVTSPVYSYVLEVPTSITSAAGLRGQKLGVSTAGSSSDVGLRVALRRVGLDPDRDVSIVPIGDVPTRTAALRSGAIAGTVLNPPETGAVEREGFHPLLDLAALKLPAVLQSTIVQRSFAETNRDVVQRYVDSLIEAVARIHADKTFTVGVLKKYFKLDDERLLSATYDFFAGEVIASAPSPRPELFADAIAELSKRNEKAKGFDAKSIIDASFVQSAIDRGLTKH